VNILSDIDINRIFSLLSYNVDEPLIFSSGLFLFLFCSFMFVYSLIHKNQRIKILFVTAFSLFFYYKSSGLYFIILLITTLVDFSIGHFIYKNKEKWKKYCLLLISLLFNIGVLVYFKYTNFFFQLFYDLSNTEFKPFDIFLPIGVSFFTFQSMSYTIDIYRGKLKPLKNIINYAFYVSFFPQLVAGPIVRASEFIPQILNPTRVNKTMIGKGIFLILTGLFKKAVIADYISTNFVARVFENPTLYSGFENLIGVYGYALRIYCDFSGYSDMAIGIALLLGYKFNINFNSPYKSKNITEFWRRWHISLSSWLKDYLYISFGGNRKGKIRTYIHLLLTMLIGGLWHGQSIKFIFWGALHGLGLIFHKLYQSIFKIEINNKPLSFIYNFLSWMITFHFVCFCWIYFRSENIETAHEIMHQILYSFNWNIALEFIQGYKVVSTLIILGFITHFLPAKFDDWSEKMVIKSNWLLQSVYICIIIIIVIQFKSSDIQPFIYFQF